MSGHHESAPVEPWPGGWLVALLAGLFAAVIAVWLGGAHLSAAALVGLCVFFVHGVVLAMYWTEPPAQGDGHGHAHHDGHDHGGHH